MDLEQRMLGCLFAGAAGDALGYAVEFDKWKYIRSQYGDAGIQSYELVHGKAIVSDDTQMTLFTGEGIVLGLTRGDIGMREAVYQAYLCWLNTQRGYGRTVPSIWSEQSWLMKDAAMLHPRAPGNTCLMALGSGVMGTMETPINNSKGCGAVMRTALCGFAPAQASHEGVQDEDTAAVLGAMAGALTHGHPMGWIPGAMLADLVYRVVYTAPETLMAAAEQSLAAMERLYGAYPQMPAFTALMRRAMALAESDTDDMTAIKELGEGWVGDEALAVAVYCALRYQHDLPGCLRAAVNHDGDSDSTGAIAGNILGAWLGVDALGKEWIEPLDVKASIEMTAAKMLKEARKQSCSKQNGPERE